MLSPGHLCFESVDPRHHVVVAVCKGKVRVLVLDLSGDRSRMELYCTVLLLATAEGVARQERCVCMWR